MPAVKVKEVLENWTPRQKRAMFMALARELMPAVQPTEAERAAALKEIMRRRATQHRAVSFDQFMASIRNGASTQE